MDEAPDGVKRCECGKTLGHVLSPSSGPGAACWPVPLPSGEPPHRRTGYPTAEGMARIRAEWEPATT